MFFNRQTLMTVLPRATRVQSGSVRSVMKALLSPGCAGGAGGGLACFTGQSAAVNVWAVAEDEGSGRCRTGGVPARDMAKPVTEPAATRALATAALRAIFRRRRAGAGAGAASVPSEGV